MVGDIEFKMVWEPEQKEHGDLKVEVYDIVREVLDKCLTTYYEEESNEHEVIGGNEYIQWSVYVVEDDVYAYDIKIALLYHPFACRISIEGPHIVDDLNELKNVLYYAEQAGNDKDVKVIKKLIEKAEEYEK